jgi:putative hydroxymethylpyrimidine transport system substrate-binding protein
MRVGHLVVAGVLIVVLLVGCGGADGTSDSNKEKADLHEVTLTLDGYPGPENVGILMAQQRGFFADAGLDVFVGRPIRPRRPVTYVSNNSYEFGVVQEPQVVLTRERGASIVAVGSLISHPTAALIWLKNSKIHTIADLKGKTIAITGVPYQEYLLVSVLARAGLKPEDVHVVKVAYRTVPALLEGRADAIFGGSWNLDGTLLRARGAKPVIRRVQDLGVPDYDEFQVIARTERVAADPKMIHSFMSAVARGTAAAVEDPEGALEAIEEGPEPNPEINRQEMEAQLKATLPLLSKSGYMNPEQAGELVEWMHRQGITQRELSVSKLLTNAYLAPQP